MLGKLLNIFDFKFYPWLNGAEWAFLKSIKLAKDWENGKLNFYPE